MSGPIEQLVVVDRLETRAGEASHDPRLQPLDLSTHLEAWTITVEDTGGNAVPAAQVLVRTADDHSWRRSRTDQQGRAVVVSATERLQVRVDKEGYRRACLEGVVSSQKIVLNSPILVDMILPKGFSHPEPPYSLEAIAYEARKHIYPGREPSLPFWHIVARQPFKSSRRVSLTIPTPGEYMIRLSVGRYVSRVGRRDSAVYKDNLIIEDRPQQIELSIDMGKLKRATDRLERQIQMILKRSSRR